MTADDGNDGLGRAQRAKADPASREGRVHAPAAHRRLLGRKPAADASWNLRMVSAGLVIPVGLVKDSPTLLVLAVEDACWQFSRADHLGRRPLWYRRRARRQWKAEQAVLDAKRLRLQEMARGEAPAL
jgi:hypothetical protein